MHCIQETRFQVVIIEAFLDPSLYFYCVLVLCTRYWSVAERQTSATQIRSIHGCTLSVHCPDLLLDHATGLSTP